MFCGNLIEITSAKTTYEGKHLYEVLINVPTDQNEDDRPIIVVDAGQEAGIDAVGLALYLIEQLVSCKENNDLISNVRWVFLPNTNPDGQEFARITQYHWKKNLRPSEDGLSYGVDVSRNFQGDWKLCPTITNGFSSNYPGPAPSSENETVFVQDVLNKYKKDIKGYLSIRRDGHGIAYPYGHDSAGPPGRQQLEKAAAAIAARVNQRSGGVHLFKNVSIFEMNGKPRCGHSVDYAYQHLSIKYSFEMRVFLGFDNHMLARFQNLPRGYDSTLRNGYYVGLKEFYNIINKERSRRHGA